MSNRKVKIRVASDDDLAILTTLIEASSRALSRDYYTDREIEAAIEHVFGVNAAMVQDRTYYVATIDEQVVGCGGWSRRRTLYGGDQRPVGGDDLLDPSREPAKIRAFFVAPEAARQGVGTAIFNACVDASLADGFTSLELMSTLPGVPFYRALGFTESVQIIDELPDGTRIRFVRMQRSLKT